MIVKIFILKNKSSLLLFTHKSLNIDDWEKGTYNGKKDDE